MKASSLAVSMIASFILVSPPLFAAGHESEFEAMRAQLQAFSERLDQLEQSNRELRRENVQLKETSEKNAAAVAEVSEAAGAASWADRIQLKGDFRYRYENTDEEFKDSRNRNRIRARAAIIANVADGVEVGLGFASGGDDPVSTNQTLGGGTSTKDMRLDLAYFQWSGLENTRIIGGKFKNLFYKPGKHGMLWDGDWNPEGFGLAWADGDYFVNAMGTWLESDSKKETEFSYGVQAGFKKSIGDNAGLTAGIGYFYLGTKGKGSFFGGDDDFFGNSFDPVANTYLYNYEELELFADLGFEIGDQPASVFVDYVQNQDAGSFDTGYALGFKYGSASNKGGWSFGYTWQDTEADASIGLLADSDFAGGGTDVRGHVLKGSYAVAKNWNANFTYFINEVGFNAQSERDYDRMQLDLAFKY